MILERLKESLQQFVEATVGRRLAYAFPRAGVIVGQASDDTVEVLLDNAKLRGTGGSGITVRHGLAGCTQELERGTRVLLMFEDGEPDKPVIIGFERGVGPGVTETAIDAGVVKLGAAVSDVVRHRETVDIAGVMPGPGVTGVMLSVNVATAPGPPSGFPTASKVRA